MKPVYTFKASIENRLYLDCYQSLHLILTIGEVGDETSANAEKYK